MFVWVSLMHSQTVSGTFTSHLPGHEGQDAKLQHRFDAAHQAVGRDPPTVTLTATRNWCSFWQFRLERNMLGLARRVWWLCCVLVFRFWFCLPLSPGLVAVLMMLFFSFPAALCLHGAVSCCFSRDPLSSCRALHWSQNCYFAILSAVSNLLADFFTLILVSHLILGHQPSVTTFNVALREFCTSWQLKPATQVWDERKWSGCKVGGPKHLAVGAIFPSFQWRSPNLLGFPDLVFRLPDSDFFFHFWDSMFLLFFFVGPIPLIIWKDFLSLPSVSLHICWFAK